ncbi:MAG: hypothetical protein HQL53_13300, partial [Magnetococcales bacterium]|nr:hypothetical protein [Magnetococcales bacterium]
MARPRAKIDESNHQAVHGYLERAISAGRLAVEDKAKNGFYQLSPEPTETAVEKINLWIDANLSSQDRRKMLAAIRQRRFVKKSDMVNVALPNDLYAEIGEIQEAFGLPSKARALAFLVERLNSHEPAMPDQKSASDTTKQMPNVVLSDAPERSAATSPSSIPDASDTTTQPPKDDESTLMEAATQSAMHHRNEPLATAMPLTDADDPRTPHNTEPSEYAKRDTEGRVMLSERHGTLHQPTKPAAKGSPKEKLQAIARPVKDLSTAHQGLARPSILKRQPLPGNQKRRRGPKLPFSLPNISLSEMLAAPRQQIDHWLPPHSMARKIGATISGVVTVIGVGVLLTYTLADPPETKARLENLTHEAMANAEANEPRTELNPSTPIAPSDATAPSTTPNAGMTTTSSPNRTSLRPPIAATLPNAPARSTTAPMVLSATAKDPFEQLLKDALHVQTTPDEARRMLIRAATIRPHDMRTVETWRRVFNKKSPPSGW